MSDDKQEEKKEKPKTVREWVKVTFRITKAEKEKLEALAQWRTEQAGGEKVFTPTDCVRGFIQNCLTGPSGWIPPDQAAREFEERKRGKDAASG